MFLRVFRVVKVFGVVKVGEVVSSFSNGHAILFSKVFRVYVIAISNHGFVGYLLFWGIVNSVVPFKTYSFQMRFCIIARIPFRA